MPGRGEDCDGEEVVIFRIVEQKDPRRPGKLVGVGLDSAIGDIEFIVGGVQ